jgi:D-threo-aldose 1-dehydrogenase
MRANDRRPFGRSELKVTALGFGSAPLGDLYARLDDETAIATVAAALASGIGLFDTSPHYGNGLAEHRLGTALRSAARDNFVLSTKVGRWMNPHEPPAQASAKPGVAAPGFAGGLPHRAVVDYSYDGTLRSFEQSLLRLGTERIDILLIHDVDVWTHGEAFEDRFREAMEGGYRALTELREQRVVSAIGVGVNEVKACARFARAGDFDCMLLAGRYSLLEQPALDEFFVLATEKKVAVLLGGVFNSGILATGPIRGARYDYKPAPPQILEHVRRIEEICHAHGIALADAAIQFPLGHPIVSSVVIGAVTPAEIARNIESLSRPIPAALWADLKTAGLLRPDAPTPA